MSVVAIKTEEEYKEIIRFVRKMCFPFFAKERLHWSLFLSSADKSSVVLFSADWAEQCKQVEDVLEDLAKLLTDKLAFVKITAEDFPEIAMKHQVC